MKKWFESTTPEMLRCAIESELEVRCVAIPVERGHVHIFYHGDETPEVVRAIARDHAPAGLSFSAHPVMDLLKSEAEARRLLPLYQWCCWGLIVVSIITTTVSLLK
jgi:hypothetical protein